MMQLVFYSVQIAALWYLTKDMGSVGTYRSMIKNTL